MTIMKKYMLFDGNFDFDKSCDAVNSMKDEHIIFAHIVKEFVTSLSKALSRSNSTTATGLFGSFLT